MLEEEILSLSLGHRCAGQFDLKHIYSIVYIYNKILNVTRYEEETFSPVKVGTAKEREREKESRDPD